MSLLNTASPWTSDESTKKRQSTMRKTFKIKSQEDHVKGVDMDIKIESPGEYVSTGEQYETSNSAPQSIDETQKIQQDRDTRVNDLLNKITNVGDSNNKLGSFQPLLPNPNLNSKKEDTGINPPPVLNTMNRQKLGNYAANDTPASVYSNYQSSYGNPTLFKKENGIAAGTIPAVRDNKLMEKINYMIQLLEEQQHEKTNNITEEFILYTFLGVFIIFVVDSFSRAGKYTR
jgi:hypothetical protein